MMTEVPDRLTQEALIAGLAARAGELSDEARNLRGAYRFSRWLKATIALGVLILLTVGVMVGLVLHTLFVVESCTTPTGTCRQRGEADTGKAVAQIVAQVNTHTDLVLLATLECSRPHVTNQQLAACLRAKGVR